ncbi:MAG: hypothetical protein AB7L90_12430 [Hyphomicrobiaceae bacterium]
MRNRHFSPLDLAISLSCAMLLSLTAGLVGSAGAHEILPGVTGFPSLVLHPFVAVETALVLLGFAIVVGAAGLRPPLGWGIVMLAAGAVAGVLLQTAALVVPGLWRLPLVLALCLGAVAATGLAASGWCLAAMSLLVSTAIGVAVPPERPGLAGRAEAAAAVIAAILATVLVVSLPRFALSRFRAVRLAGRVGGAWIMAIALLGLAVLFR